MTRRRLLLVSPHFPPDSSAGTHRARLLAKWLPSAGWDPTVLTVDARDYDSRLDPTLASLLPADLRVVRVRAISTVASRWIGFGDLGLRALPALRNAALDLTSRESFDAVFVTIYPSYPAVIGRWLHQRAGIPFVLDYQDPWVGAWGLHVGVGVDGAPDVRSRVTRAIATRLEPWTLRAADGITAVSRGTYDEVCTRVPRARELPFLELPIGADPDDISHAAATSHDYFAAHDGNVHLCFVGTVLPLGIPAIRAVLEAIVLLRGQQPALGARIRAHFIGTSNQSAGGAPRVMPLAHEMGLAEVVSEETKRIIYLEALAVQRDASIILLLGSTEPHYTPSKIFPALLTGRPLLAIYHGDSSARALLSAARDERSVEFMALNESPADELAAKVAHAIATLAQVLPSKEGMPSTLSQFAAPRMAHTLAAFLDMVVDRVHT